MMWHEINLSTQYHHSRLRVQDLSLRRSSDIDAQELRYEYPYDRIATVMTSSAAYTVKQVYV